MAEITRRMLLKLAGCGGVSALAAGMGVKNARRLIPLVIPPTEEFRPGQWMHYATTCRECPAGCGMHARCVDGRVQKCEGNPDHPVSRGGLCPRGQSAVQGLYDPDRLKSPLLAHGGNLAPASLPQALEETAKSLAAPDARLAIISDLQTGAMADLLRQFAAAFGTDRVLLYEPFNYDSLRRAHELVFGRAEIPRVNLDQAAFIISFGADFLETWVSPVEFARAFADRRSRSDAPAHMVYAGPRLSMTAGNADKYYQLTPRQTLSFAVAMLGKVIELGLTRHDISAIKPALDKFLGKVQYAINNGPGLPQYASALPIDDAAVTALTKAFFQADGAVALAGPVGMNDDISYHTGVAAALLNYAAGSIGKTVDFAHIHALSRTATDTRVERFLAGLTKQDVLIIHNSNIAYSHPDGGKVRNAGKLIYLGLLPDETAGLADVVLPIDSPLEAWGDYEPWTGIHNLSQPTMTRLQSTVHAGDALLAMAAAAGKNLHPDDATPAHSFDAWLEHRWRNMHKVFGSADEFSAFWQDCLRRGGTVEAVKPAEVTLAPGAANWQPALWGTTSGPNLWLWPSIMLFDGRTANRGWLQEAPDPTSTIVWGSYLEINPADAESWSLKDGDAVRLDMVSSQPIATQIPSRSVGGVELAARVTDDIAPGVLGTFFGQGHTAMGRNAAGHGCNAFALLRVGASYGGLKIVVQKLSKGKPPINLSNTQDQHSRPLLQWAAADRLDRPADGETGERYDLPLPEGYSGTKDLYPAPKYKQYRWGMVIDLDKCIGCGACAVACYAENNIPVIGPEQCSRGREMAWLKVAPYRRQDDPGRVGWMPLPCQHCDAAPCEPVCPVFASVHNAEGLNAQVYNRCIGTRYCSNNCPYKVRRFNWINVDWPRPLDWQLNPQVTVRCRGVMEKCTFCIQRIRQGQQDARRHGRKIADGDIAPACAQSCPTRAIVFGNLLDENSSAGRLARTDPRRYHLLAGLNTKPAVTYLRRILRQVPGL